MLTDLNETGTKTPALDLAELRKRTDGDDGLLRAVVELFLSECPGWVAQLEEAVRKRDTAAVRAIAHRLGGTAATVGAMRTSKAAYGMETACKWGRAAELEGLLSELTAAADEAFPLFRDLVATSPV